MGGFLFGGEGAFCSTSFPVSGEENVQRKEEQEKKKQEEAALFPSQTCWERRTGTAIQRTIRLNEEQ